MAFSYMDIKRRCILMKRIISIFMILLMLFSVFSVTANAVSDYYEFYEEESNNSVYLSDRIYNECIIMGSLSSNDLDYYEFILPYRATVFLTCCASYEPLLAGILDSTEETVKVATGYYEEGNYFDNLTVTLNAGTYYICLVQDSRYGYSNIPYAMAFDYVSEVPEHTHYYSTSVVEPTCTQKGYTIYTCSCGDNFTADYTSALGHTESSWIVESYPTSCYENGSKYKECTRCGITVKAESIPATHSLISSIPGTPATYNSTGLTIGSVCLSCGYEIVTQKTIPMLKLHKVNKLKLSSATTSSIKLTWSSVTGAEKYEVYYSTNSKKWKKITTTKKSVTIKKLKSGTNYKVKVRAVSGDNKGSYSSVLTTSTKPSKVTLNTLKSTKAKQAVATWKTISGVTGYEVTYSTSKKFTKKSTKTVTIKKAKTKKTTLKKLKGGKKYYVKVRAYKIVNGKKIYGSWSSAKSVKVK